MLFGTTRASRLITIGAQQQPSAYGCATSAPTSAPPLKSNRSSELVRFWPGFRIFMRHPLSSSGARRWRRRWVAQGGSRAFVVRSESQRSTRLWRMVDKAMCDAASPARLIGSLALSRSRDGLLGSAGASDSRKTLTSAASAAGASNLPSRVRSGRLPRARSEFWDGTGG